MLLVKKLGVKREASCELEEIDSETCCFNSHDQDSLIAVSVLRKSMDANSLNPKAKMKNCQLE